MRRLLFASMVVFLLAAGSAAGSRIATPTEKRGIAAGVRFYVRTSGCCAIKRVRLTLYRVSTLDQDFARVTVFPVLPSGQTGPAAVAVAVHTYTGRWVVLAFGTAQLACGLQPSIRDDLGLADCR